MNTKYFSISYNLLNHFETHVQSLGWCNIYQSFPMYHVHATWKQLNRQNEKKRWNPIIKELFRTMFPNRAINACHAILFSISLLFLQFSLRVRLLRVKLKGESKNAANKLQNFNSLQWTFCLNLILVFVTVLRSLTFFSSSLSFSLLPFLWSRPQNTQPVFVICFLLVLYSFLKKHISLPSLRSAQLFPRPLSSVCSLVKMKEPIMDITRVTRQPN